MRQLKLTGILIIKWAFISLAQGEDREFQEDFMDRKYLFRHLAARVRQIEIRDQLQQHIINELQKELKNQKAELNALEIKIAEKENLNIKLRNATERQSNPLKSSTRAIKADDGDDRTNEIKVSQRLVTVAFSAGLSHTVEHLHPNQNIIFDHVETNIGNGYNSLNGVFTAPINGTYMIFSSILSVKERQSQCLITVNGKHKAGMQAYDSRTTDQGSQMLIVILNQGDNVSVQNKDADSQLYGDYNIWSTFSGYLL